MKLTLECPKAQYDTEMRIRCLAADGGLCAHQRFRQCKGWCVLTGQAKDCPARGDEGNERKRSKSR